MSRESTLENALDVLNTMNHDPEESYEYFTFDRALTDEEIETKWHRNGMVASHKHQRASFVGIFFNGLPLRWWEGEMKVLFQFVHDIRLSGGGIFYRKEIVCADADVAGSIDLLVKLPDGTVDIIDFKRSDKLRVK